jgi:hypothetical protein
MSKDRNLVSLLADTSILAASDRTVLIQSKIDTTNNLINDDIDNLEKLYEEYLGNKVRFAALDDNLWKKETEKYRLNVKNKVEYSYVDEEENVVDDNQQNVDAKDDIESVAEDIFGTFEVE